MEGSALIRIAGILPKALMELAGPLPADMTELRLRAGRPVEIRTPDKDLLSEGVLEAPLLKKAVDALTDRSLYAWDEQLRQGYFTLEGGCRVGVCGRFAVSEGKILSLSGISSVIIRVAREVRGAANPLMRLLYEQGAPLGVLVLSPPGLGKTTLLRDIARQYSYGTVYGRALSVGIADERSELAACVRGIPTMDVGPRTDVIDACPKDLSLPMLIRTASPEVIVTDELGQARDAEAVLEALRSGIRVVASAHAATLDDAMSRPSLKPLFETHVFDRVVVLAGRVGQIAQILTGYGGILAGEEA